MAYYLYRNLMRIIPIFLQWGGIFSAKLRRRNQGLAYQMIPRLDGCIWIHSASLGEFEQGKMVIDSLRRNFPDKKLVLTFFSSSGYDKRKDYPGVDYVLYLPYDSPKAMHSLIENLQPQLVVVIKYEFWFNMLDTLCNRGIPFVFISSAFRPGQFLFHFSFRSLLKKLRCASHVFVQNQASGDLLRHHGFSAVTVAGDTRMDRVMELSKESFDYPIIQEWIGTSFCLIAGSTWPADEELLKQCIIRFPEWKWLIAPHELGPEQLTYIQQRFGDQVCLLSDLERQDHPGLYEKPVLLIDRIGLLSRIYRYGDIAYIGGGFGAGIHNTLEPAVYGLPLIFGPRYKKFQEAVDFHEIGAAKAVTSFTELCNALETFSEDSFREEIGHTLNHYFEKNQGATELIMETIENILPK